MRHDREFDEAIALVRREGETTMECLRRLALEEAQRLRLQAAWVEMAREVARGFEEER